MIGLGLMGSAIAEAFLRGGCDLTVWNRSPERTEPFAGAANVAPTVAAASGAGDVVVVCLTSPTACRSVLRQTAVEASIGGKLLVQMTTSTPADARDEAEWAGACGARYLGGAILAAPVMVGTPKAKAFFSGAEEAFTQCLPLLKLLTPDPTYCGDNIGGAATIDHALLEVTYGCQAVLFHAMAICEAGSIPLPFFLSQLTLFADGFLEQRAGAIGSGSYPSGTASLHTFKSWAEQLVRTAEDAGVDVALPVTLLRSITKTVELGHGDDDYQALFETFRRAR